MLSIPFEHTGNVKEKVAAASRQGITHIVLPSANIKQFRRLPTKSRNAVKALKADHMLEVIKHAVEPPLCKSDCLPVTMKVLGIVFG